MYDKANQLYHNKQFTEAIDLYNQLLEDGYQHDALYYNLGNAYYRNNQFGMAIWGYKKAIQISNRKNYRDNLTLAERKTGVIKSNQGTIFFIRWWHNIRTLFSANVWAMGSLFCLILSCIILIVRRWKSYERRMTPAVYFLWVLGVLGMLFSLSTVYHKKKAIVVGHSTTFITSDHRHSLQLTEGLEVVLGKRVGVRCMIVLPDGTEGWVEAKSIRSL